MALIQVDSQDLPLSLLVLIAIFIQEVMHMAVI